MKIRCRHAAWQTCVWLLLLSTLPLHAGGPKPKPNDPAYTIPLEPLGFLPPAAIIVGSGATQFTLNFVDDKHLLFTYFSRGLLARLPDVRPGDNDANITALLLELPEGKVVGRTQWRVRDRDTYLWPIGHGRFLTRVRSKLTLLDPLGNLAAGDPFREEPFGELPRRIGYITTSATGDLLTLETIPQPKPPADPSLPAELAGPDPAAGKPPVEIFFYRMKLEEQKGQRAQFVRQLAGAVAAANLINIPANADGYLSAQKESASVYDFDFHPHSGGTVPLSPFDTTCAPHVYFISRSEFVALGCHGDPDKPVLGQFNLKGQNDWIEVLAGKQVAPAILAAPVAGRFALSRTVLSTTASGLDLDNITPAEVTGQEISVRQSYDGKLLLKVQASPVQRASQNFDLSPDGMTVAVVRAGGISVYRLPELGTKDREALKLAAAMEPARNEAPIRLNSVAMPTRASSAPDRGSTPERSGKPAVMDSSSANTSATPLADDGQTGIGASAGVDLIPGEAPVNAPAPIAPPPSAQPAGDVPQQQRPPPSLYTPDHPRQPGDPKPNAPTESPRPQ